MGGGSEKVGSPGAVGLTGLAGESAGAVALSPYPEHDKLLAVAEQSQAIGEFLDMGRWTLCEERTFDGHERPMLVSVDIQAALAEYFGIARDALEREKRAMLADLRGRNGC